MRFETLRVLALAPIAASAIFAACGSGSEDAAPEDTRTLQERLFSGSGFDFAKQQELIRDCMVKQGFEYTPMDTREGGASGTVFSFDRDSEDFVSEYGFGISTLFGREIDIREQPKDANQVYRESLDETQRAAYDKALYGQAITIDGGTGASVISIGGSAPVGSTDGATAMGLSGCMGEAFEASGAQVQTFDPDVFDDLQDLEERIQGDPKMAEAMKKWSTCMADSGFQYRDRTQAMDEIQDEFSELTGLEFAGAGGAVFSVAGSVSVTSGGDDGPGETPRFDPLANVDKEKLTALQTKEKQVAVASQECSDKHVASTEAEVRERLEAEFLEEHPDLKERAAQ